MSELKNTSFLFRGKCCGCGQKIQIAELTNHDIEVEGISVIEGLHQRSPQEEAERALATLEKLNPEPGKPVSDEQFSEYERACSAFIILEFETIRRVLLAAARRV